MLTKNKRGTLTLHQDVLWNFHQNYDRFPLSCTIFPDQNMQNKDKTYDSRSEKQQKQTHILQINGSTKIVNCLTGFYNQYNRKVDI